MTNPTPADRAAKVLDGVDLTTVDRAWLAQAIATEIQAESNAQLMRGRAHDRQADVAAFVRKFGQARRETPGWPEQKDLDMRVRLIAEEFCEFMRAAGYQCSIQIERPSWPPGMDPESTTPFGIVVFENEEECEDLRLGVDGKTAYETEERNLPAAADGLIDMEYVILGTHVTMGIDSNPLWDEVQKANMAKEGGATREDGKILKPHGWQPPDIEGALRRQGWRSDSDVSDAEFEMLPENVSGSTGR